MRGVEVDGERIEADAVVIAMGPWSLLAAQWLRLPPVFGRTSPSLVFDTGTDVPADALFLDCPDETGAVVTVEVFPRANGNTHVTAFSNERSAAARPGGGRAGRRGASTVCTRSAGACRRHSTRPGSSPGRHARAR